MPITKAELARHWNVTPQRITQYAKDGCPLVSTKAADRWRARRSVKRQATNSKFAAEREGLEPIEKKEGDGRRRGRPLTTRPMPMTGDKMLDALNAARNVQERASEEYEKAMCSGSYTRVSPLLHVHTKALEARFMAEEKYREELERRGELVDKAIIIEMTRRVMDAVLRRLKKLPQEKGPECNPQNPIIAVSILEAEVNNIIATGRTALEAYSR